MGRLKSYLSRTYRRKILDKLQEKYSSLYRGVVLDIGGRDRGGFRKPKEKVDRWIFADIEEKHQPDIVLDVADMKNFSDNSVDVINAMELFEHVYEIEKGLGECKRVLKTDGNLIISVPFLYQIHADPSDFQRWTIFKWEKELQTLGFMIESVDVMGRFFTLFADMAKVFNRSMPLGIKHIFYLTFPFLDFLVSLDNSSWIAKHPKLSNFHGGYFFVLKKVQ